MMSLDYDTLDTAPSNLVEASQLAKYKVSPLYCPVEFSIPVNHPGNNSWLYTFDLSATTNTVDLKTYNLGNFFLSLDGVPQDGKDYGYLAVEYDVELLDKNPVVNVFASLTYDSGVPATKSNRTNVDPADTMELTVTWAPPTGTLNYKNTCTIVFDDSVPSGARARISLLLTAQIEAESSSSTTVRFGDFTLPEDATLLSNTRSTVTTTSTSTQSCLSYLALDVVVPADHTLSLLANASTGTRFTKSTNPAMYGNSIMAYTYA
jgi:hypothetical protein